MSFFALTQHTHSVDPLKVALYSVNCLKGHWTSFRIKDVITGHDVSYLKNFFLNEFYDTNKDTTICQIENGGPFKNRMVNTCIF